MPVRVPPQRLSPETLAGLIEEYVTRSGTDYGEVEAGLADKVADVRQQLERGEAVIVFDDFSETCDILRADQLPPDVD